MQTRRTILLGGAAALVAGGGAWAYLANDTVATGAFPLSLTDAEWRERLGPEEYAVLRQGGTETPFSSPLDTEKASGTFACAGCAQPVYSSDAKFDSGTGWPSFSSAIEGGVGTKPDRSFLMTRTEVHCSNCGGHLGHIFDDGPAPTGKRHCLNGVALEFSPA